MRALLYPTLLLGIALAGCVDELVVGLRQPLQPPDAGAGDPLDAEPWDEDAKPVADAELPDASPPPEDNAVTPFDAGPVPGACGTARCGDSTVGPCYSCAVILQLIPGSCSNGAPETCWDDGSGNCTMQCPAVASCASSADCEGDEYCFFQMRDCGANSLGVCAPRPTSCLDIVDSKCACDGIVYRSACEAARAGQPFGDDLQQTCK